MYKKNNNNNYINKYLLFINNNILYYYYIIFVIIAFNIRFVLVNWVVNLMVLLVVYLVQMVMPFYLIPTPVLSIYGRKLKIIVTFFYLFLLFIIQ